MVLDPNFIPHGLITIVIAVILSVLIGLKTNKYMLRYRRDEETSRAIGYLMGGSLAAVMIFIVLFVPNGSKVGLIVLVLIALAYRIYEWARVIDWIDRHTNF